MSKCLGRFLGCIDSNPVLTTGQLEEALPTHLIIQLKDQGLLEPIERSEWFCDDCLESHLYDISKPPSIYRACINQFPPLYEPVSETDRYDWEWQWGRFRFQLCKVNSLSSDTEGTFDAEILGFDPKRIVIWSPSVVSSDIIRLVRSQRLTIPNKRLAVILRDEPLLTHNDNESLDQLNAELLILETLLNSGWKLPKSTFGLSSVKNVVTTGHEKVFGNSKAKRYSATLDTINQRLLIGRKPYPLKTAFYHTARILWQLEGGLLKTSNYQDYLEEIVGEMYASYDLARHIMELRKFFKAHFKKNLDAGKEPILSKPRVGYQLNTDAWNFKTLS